MHMYYSDDELRKQAELMTNSCVHTGRESPNMNKSMRDDLIKKHVTADLVACRLPYARRTQQVELRGWNRFYMDNILRFSGLAERTWDSMYRRGLWLTLKGRFLIESQLLQMFPSLDEAARQGHFVKGGSDLKDCLTSGPACAATLMMLEGWCQGGVMRSLRSTCSVALTAA